MLPAPMSRKSVLGILSIGFGLVILLVAAVAYIGSRKARDIQASSAALVREHLMATRLVDELEAEQRRMANILLSLSRFNANPSSDAEQIFQDVDGGMNEIRRLSDEEASSADRALWTQLAEFSALFVRKVRTTLSDPKVTEGELETLVDLHDRFVHMAGQIIKTDQMRASAVEQRVQADSKELLDQSSWLLGACFVLAGACAVVTV